MVLLVVGSAPSNGPQHHALLGSQDARPQYHAQALDSARPNESPRPCIQCTGVRAGAQPRRDAGGMGWREARRGGVARDGHEHAAGHRRGAAAAGRPGGRAFLPTRDDARRPAVCINYCRARRRQICRERLAPLLKAPPQLVTPPLLFATPPCPYQVVKTQSMRASPYIGPFEERVRAWEARLSTAQDALDAWLKCQKVRRLRGRPGPWPLRQPLLQVASQGRAGPSNVLGRRLAWQRVRKGVPPPGTPVRMRR